MINPKILSFVFVSLFIFVIGASMVISVNAQVQDRDIPAGDKADSVKDTIEGGTPRDTIEGGSPRDTIEGGALRDTIEGGTPSSSIFTLQNPLKVNSIGELLHSFVQIFTYLVILFAVIMFVYLGFQYVLFASQGNASKIAELHTKFIWLVVGVAIVIGARVLIQVVINTLSATGTVSPDVIESANNALKK